VTEAVVRVPVGHPDAVAVLRAYFDDVASRYYGRQATEEEIDAALAEDPSDHLDPPTGLFFVAREGDQVDGCVGVKFAEPGIAELTRMFVKKRARRRGWGTRLLETAEEAARRNGARTMRLDTRDDLVEARALYANHGYREVPPFGSGLYADHWLEKIFQP
jgi:GNAT superfamily N-acetyltransferase